MRACERAGRWREALGLLDEMARRDVRPNPHTYAAAIGALGSHRLWREALGLLDRLEEEGLQADAHVMNAALLACGGAGQWAAAFDLLRERMPRLGVPPSAHHLHVAVKCAASKGQLRNALDLMRYAERAGVEVDAKLVDLGLCVCAKAGAAQDTILLLRMLSRARLPLSERMRCSSISALGRGGQWELAVRLLRASSDVACHNAALSVLVRAERCEAAIALLHRMRERGPTPDHVTARIAKRLRRPRLSAEIK